MSVQEQPIKQKTFNEEFREKIEKQIQDIDQINIMTGVSSNLTGTVNPEAQSLMSFIEAKANDIIKGKALGSSSSSSAKRSEDFKPLEAPDITKTSQDLNATVLARTIIELDGDILLLLRGQQIDNQGKQVVSLDSSILAAHQANVNIAVENWHFFVSTALEALKSVRDLVRT